MCHGVLEVHNCRKKISFFSSSSAWKKKNHSAYLERGGCTILEEYNSESIEKYEYVRNSLHVRVVGLFFSVGAKEQHGV